MESPWCLIHTQPRKSPLSRCPPRASAHHPVPAGMLLADAVGGVLHSPASHSGKVTRVGMSGAEIPSAGKWGVSRWDPI